MIAPAVMVVAPSLAYAEDGVLEGRVLHAETKEPIPDVVIAVTSPELEGERIVVTDVTGNFRVPGIPIKGGYTVSLDAGVEFQPSLREGITLASGQATRLDFLLSPQKAPMAKPPETEFEWCPRFRGTNYQCLLSYGIPATLDEELAIRRHQPPLVAPKPQVPVAPRKTETPKKAIPSTTIAPSSGIKLNITQEFFRRVPFFR